MVFEATIINAVIYFIYFFVSIKSKGTEKYGHSKL